MTDHFITLKCENCGGKIDVYDDMKRFACGFCGTEMLVQRRGGTVLLEKLTEAAAQAHASIDKAGAEIETINLTRERDELLGRLTGMNEDFEKALYVIGGAIVVFLSPLYFYYAHWVWVALALAGPIAWGIYRFILRHQAKTLEVQKQIDKIKARLAELKK